MNEKWKRRYGDDEYMSHYALTNADTICNWTPAQHYSQHNDLELFIASSYLMFSSTLFCLPGIYKRPLAVIWTIIRACDCHRCKSSQMLQSVKVNQLHQTQSKYIESVEFGLTLSSDMVMTDDMT